MFHAWMIPNKVSQMVIVNGGSHNQDLDLFKVIF